MGRFHCRKDSLCKLHRGAKNPPTKPPITLTIFNLRAQISLRVTLNERQEGGINLHECKLLTDTSLLVLFEPPTRLNVT